MLTSEDLPVYLGQYRHRFDQKNRLTIPSRWMMGDNITPYFFGWVHPQKYLQVYPAQFLRKLRSYAEAVHESDEKARGIKRILFGHAYQFLPDQQNRIKIEPELAQAIHLNDRAVLVGECDNFSLWNPEIFDGCYKESFDFTDALSEFESLR